MRRPYAVIAFVLAALILFFLLRANTVDRQTPPRNVQTQLVDARTLEGETQTRKGGEEPQATGGGQTEQADGRGSSVGAALSTIFSPSRAPKRKTMGLLQRSFLDLADQGGQELEVAIVVDGTTSMTTELQGVRSSILKMLEDLRDYRRNEVRVAFVIYRDSGSPSGAVSIPFDDFTTDKEAIAEAVASLQAESGAPYFHELADEGLYKALTELHWSDDDQVAKWIMMFGDAPPYAESYRDKKWEEAYRHYATSYLLSIAKEKNIRINCVLCKSSDIIFETYEKAKEETRDFMNSLSAGTDGLMLDLSEEAIRTAMIEASKQPEAELVPIEPIDLEAVRRNLAQRGRVEKVSLAVIPHMPLDQMRDEPANPAVQISTALRTKLATVPGVHVASTRDIKDQLRRLRAEGITEDKAIRALAARLGVDFVVWGSLAPDKETFQTAAYRRDDGGQIATIQLAMHSGDMAYSLIEASAKNAPDDPALSQLFAKMQEQQESMNAPMATTTATSDELLTAIEALDQALGYEAGSEESVKLLEQADRASENAATAEPTNALAHWLQANVAYNQASYRYRTGDKQAGNKRKQDMRSSLAQALKNISSVKTPSLVTEIQADYYLLVKRDPTKAVERYLAMTKTEQPLQSQLRGHWMLAGIYAGDWGNAEESIVDPAEARRHVIEILSNWPESPEAKLLKEWLRWDETKQRTEFNYLPQVNAELTEA